MRSARCGDCRGRRGTRSGHAGANTAQAGRRARRRLAVYRPPIGPSIGDGLSAGRFRALAAIVRQHREAGLLRQLRAQGFPTLRRVVEEAKGNTVIF